MGRILAAGPFPAVRLCSPAGTRLADHGNAALLPALVNAHTHLELSALRGRIPFPQLGFSEWIKVLFPLRIAMAAGQMDEALRSGLAELLSHGTALCADITNGAGMADEMFAPVGRCPGAGIADSAYSKVPERQIFLELLGFNIDSVSAAMPPGIDMPDGAALVPHSVYSVSPAIIAEAKEWTRVRGLPFSIHAAEHPEEIEFLQSGKGFCRELLEWLGRWDPRWTPPAKTPVEYLNCLGVLDSRTLLVHAVHMTESDWGLAAGRDCTAVFCPRSNRNLGSGSPRIDRALSLGMRCALATDSLASNTDLDLFAEAAFALAILPSLDPERVIEMITLNPARALGRKGRFGSLEPGAGAHILAITIQSEVDESNLCEALIESGKEGAWKWVS
jgi:cytosine/adenosine deaminase-related metal-dependent hydrolase